jgi:hypothetical protein
MLNLDMVRKSLITFRAFIQFFHINSANEADKVLIIKFVCKFFPQITKRINNDTLNHVEEDKHQYNVEKVIEEKPTNIDRNEMLIHLIIT